MILFWTIGGLLAAVALVLLLRPLLRGAKSQEISRRDANISIYRDQLRELDADLAAGKLAAADHARARTELEARLLEDVAAPEPSGRRTAGRGVAIAVGLALPLFALTIYFLVGSPGALRQTEEHAMTVRQLETMVERLAAKLRENPDDVDGWRLLGRSYTVMGRFPEAADAYAKAAVRSPRDAQLLVDFADVLAMTRGRKLEGEPARLIDRALEIDPNNLKGLALAGTVAFERQDYARAAAIWSRMLPLVPAGSEDARVIAQNVDEASKLAGIAAPAKSDGKRHPGVRGTVRLAPALKGEVKSDDLVFVFARAAEGPPMPLAVLRAKAGELPLRFQLNDSMAMRQGLQISAYPKIVVTARISRSGKAQAAAGDLQGTSKPVANDASGVTVLIDTVLR